MLGGGLVGFAGSGLFLLHDAFARDADNFPFPTTWREFSMVFVSVLRFATLKLKICSLAAIVGAVVGILIGTWIPKIVIVVTVVIYALLIASFTTK